MNNQNLLFQLLTSPVPSLTLHEFLGLADQYDISRYEVKDGKVLVSLTNGTNISVDRVNCILSDHIRQEAIG